MNIEDFALLIIKGHSPFDRVYEILPEKYSLVVKKASNELLSNLRFSDKSPSIILYKKVLDSLSNFKTDILLEPFIEAKILIESLYYSSPLTEKESQAESKSHSYKQLMNITCLDLEGFGNQSSQKTINRDFLVALAMQQFNNGKALEVLIEKYPNQSKKLAKHILSNKLFYHKNMSSSESLIPLLDKSDISFFSIALINSIKGYNNDFLKKLLNSPLANLVEKDFFNDLLVLAAKEYHIYPAELLSLANPEYVLNNHSFDNNQKFHFIKNYIKHFDLDFIKNSIKYFEIHDKKILNRLLKTPHFSNIHLQMKIESQLPKKQQKLTTKKI